MELRATAMEAEGYGDEIAALLRHLSFYTLPASGPDLQ
jgi:hypothetical protein